MYLVIKVFLSNMEKFRKFIVATIINTKTTFSKIYLRGTKITFHPEPIYVAAWSIHHFDKYVFFFPGNIRRHDWISTQTQAVGFIGGKFHFGHETQVVVARRFWKLDRRINWEKLVGTFIKRGWFIRRAVNFPEIYRRQFSN